jgi:hypothetical protein
MNTILQPDPDGPSAQVSTKAGELHVTDFRVLSNLGLFNAQHMNHAIYQFRSFERPSLEYAELDHDEQPRRIGLWDQTEVA